MIVIGDAIFRLALDLPEDRRYVGALRRAASSLLTSTGIAKPDVEDIELILGELASNVVMHAATGNGKGYRVEIECYSDRVRLAVMDNGSGFSLTNVPAPGMPRPEGGSENERFGGWGLPLVFRLADQVEILSLLPRGTAVRVEKRLHVSQV